MTDVEILRVLSYGAAAVWLFGLGSVIVPLVIPHTRAQPLLKLLALLSGREVRESCAFFDAAGTLDRHQELSPHVWLDSYSFWLLSAAGAIAVIWLVLAIVRRED